MATKPDLEMTDPSGTWTTEGFVPHVVVGGLRCPVKIAPVYVTGKPSFGALPKVIRRLGKRAYALPGGGEFVL